MVQSVYYYLGKRKKEVPLLQNYSLIDESNTVASDKEPYFVGGTKNGLAHGRGKLFNILVKGSLCIYDAEWQNGKIRSGKLYKIFGLHVQLMYKGEFNTFFQFHGHGLHLKNDNKYEGNWKNGKKHGHCIVHTKEIMKIIKNKDMAFTHCPMVISTMEIGKMIKDTDKVFIKVKNRISKVPTLMI
jgi:hypothetical protein